MSFDQYCLLTTYVYLALFDSNVFFDKLLGRIFISSFYENVTYNHSSRDVVVSAAFEKLSLSTVLILVIFL